MELQYNLSGTLSIGTVDWGAYGSAGFGYIWDDTRILINGAWPVGNELLLPVQNNPVITLNFVGAGCISDLVLTRLHINNSGIGTGCIPDVNPDFPSSTCSPAIMGVVRTHSQGQYPNTTAVLDATVEDVRILIEPETVNATCTPTLCNILQMTPSEGTFGACVCSSCTTYRVTPSNTLDPLNGVNTWDLILINRHIGGAEPLNTPYKIIAANADNQPAITTFDIVELRKLILGTYYELPNHPSWHFVDAKQVFDPQNPFNIPNPPTPLLTETLSGVTSGILNADFIGIKVGDVDHSASPCADCKPSNETLPFEMDLRGSYESKGRHITLPFTYKGDIPVEALQAAFRFDTARYAFVALSQGNVFGVNEQCFGLQDSDKGLLRMVWFRNGANEEAQPLQKGDVLFYLTLKAKAEGEGQTPEVLVDLLVLDSRAWDTGGHGFRIAMPESRPFSTDRARLWHVPVNIGGLSVIATPNPTAGSLSLAINSEKAVSKARVGLFGAFGQTILVRNLSLAAGQQTVEIPELAKQPAGVYVWRIWSPEFQLNGTIIKE